MPNDHSSTHLNPGQQRKIRIIEKTFGVDWRTQYPDMAIDAVYNIAIQDDRKSLFCKIDKHRKEQLAEMLKEYNVTMGELIGSMIDDYFARLIEQQKRKVIGIAEDFSGMK
jgi:hypothetical protein